MKRRQAHALASIDAGHGATSSEITISDVQWLARVLRQMQIRSALKSTDTITLRLTTAEVKRAARLADTFQRHATFVTRST